MLILGEWFDQKETKQMNVLFCPLLFINQMGYYDALHILLPIVDKSMDTTILNLH